MGTSNSIVLEKDAAQNEKLQKYWELYSSHAASAKKYRAMIIEMQGMPSPIPEDGYPQSGSARSSNQMRSSPGRAGSTMSLSTPYMGANDQDHPEFDIATNEGVFTPYKGRSDTVDLDNSKDMQRLDSKTLADSRTSSKEFKPGHSIAEHKSPVFAGAVSTGS